MLPKLARRAHFEILESRQLLAVCGGPNSITASGGDLCIVGDGNANIMQVSLTSIPNRLRVRLNNTIVNVPGITGTVTMIGEGGSDTLQMTNVPLRGELFGGAGSDYLTGHTAADKLVGGGGDDRLLAGGGNNELYGDEEGGELPSDGSDQLQGGVGNDIVYGGGGADTINLELGDDYAFGGSGNDLISCSFGNDRAYGGDGNDTLGGDEGNDLLAGGAGNDWLLGRAGNDVLIGGTGSDLLNGDDGDDLLLDGHVVYDDPVNPPAAAGDNSAAAGDASDAAMAALLADWSTDSSVDPLHLTSLHDADSDTLNGGLGIDAVSPGPGDLGDVWELVI
jgi:Ca2+-binding RTX toxin-like protein